MHIARSGLKRETFHVVILFYLRQLVMNIIIYFFQIVNMFYQNECQQNYNNDTSKSKLQVVKMLINIIVDTKRNLDYWNVNHKCRFSTAWASRDI